MLSRFQSLMLCTALVAASPILAQDRPMGLGAPQPNPDSPDYRQQLLRNRSTSGPSCEGRPSMQFDYSYGRAKQEQSQGSMQRLIASYSCIGLWYEHSASYAGTGSGILPNGSLWADHISLVGSSILPEGNIHLSLGRTSVYGIRKTQANMLGILITDRSTRPLGGDLVMHLPLSTLAKGESLRHSSPEIDIEAALRYELGQASIRAGYRVMKVMTLRRNLWFAGLSFAY